MPARSSGRPQLIGPNVKLNDAGSGSTCFSDCIGGRSPHSRFLSPLVRFGCILRRNYMNALTFRRAALAVGLVLMAAIFIHLQNRIVRLEAEQRELRANYATLLRSQPKLPANNVRLTDQEFRAVLQALESRGGVDLLNESSVSRSSLQRLNTAAVKTVE